MSVEGFTIDNLEEFVGKEMGVTEWFQIDQERVNQFADCTEDHQWIHVDVEKAEKSFLGGTIAHGYLTLSLLPMFSAEVGTMPEGIAQAFNYGADKIRFLTPVKVGSRVRNRAVLMSVQDKGNGRYLLKTQNTVEIEGEEKPAMVAETLTMLFKAFSQK